MNNPNKTIKFDKNLLLNDKLYDKTSLIWENNELYEIEDKWDVDNILEGRLGEFSNERIITKMGITFIFPIVKKNKELLKNNNIVDNVTVYKMLSENRYLKIERLENSEYENKISGINNIKFLYEVLLEESNNCLSVYEGLIETESYGLMLGTIVFLSGKDEKVYEFIYAGKGNYTDVKMEKNNILKNLMRSVRR